MKLYPLADRVVIKPKAPQEISKGGIIIPVTAQKKDECTEGEIVAVGPGKFDDGALNPMDVEVGERVLYGKYSGTEIKENDITYVIIRESDILATIED